MQKLPTCLGYWDYTANGNDFDCEYPDPPDCERCLCNYFGTGGLINPETGRKTQLKRAIRIYGKPYKSFPKTKGNKK
jgi:hypothetical protein